MGRKSCVVPQNRARSKRQPVRVLPGDEESKQQQKKKKKGNKGPAASHHRGSASVPSATHRAHAMRAEAPPPTHSEVVAEALPPDQRFECVGIVFSKQPKLSRIKGGFKNRLFPLLRSPLLSLSAFVSASHFVCSCRVSVINLHQIKSSEELAKAVKRGPHSSQALDKALGELRRGSATGPLGCRLSDVASPAQQQQRCSKGWMQTNDCESTPMHPSLIILLHSGILKPV